MPTIKPSDLETLSQVPLFSRLTGDQLREITRGALLQRFPAGTVLFDQGDEPDFLHVLLDGGVQLIGEAHGGREAVIELMGPADAFIIAAALTGTPYLMRAKVQDPSRVLLLPAHQLRQSIASQPELALSMLASLAGQFRRLVRQVKNLKLRTAVQRVGCYLLQLAAEAGNGNEVHLPHDKQIIASHLGMTRESLSRALAALRDIGVHSHGDTVHLDDIEKLKGFCHPDALIDGMEAELRVRPE